MRTLVPDLLTMYTDELARGKRPDVEAILGAAGPEREELTPLLALAEQLKRVLVPVSPSHRFRATLHQGLLLAAGHRAGPELLVESPAGGWRFVWVGVAVMGSAVAAGGVIAWLIRSRHKAPTLARAD